MIRQLVGHSAAYTFANLASRGTIFVWLLVLPRFMSAADYGALGLIMTVVAIGAVVVPLEVSQGLARYYPTALKNERRGWAKSAWTFTLLAVGLTCVALLVFAPALSRLLLGDHYVSEFRFAAAYFALNTCFIFLQHQFRWAFRPRNYTLVTLTFAVASLLLSIGLAATLSNPLEGVLIGLLSGAAIGVAFAMISLRDVIGLGVDASKLSRMLRFSLPLMPAGIALLLSTYASRFILKDLLTLADVGLFTWASQLANIAPLLLLGVQAAVTPLVMKHHGDAETPALLARSFEAVFAAILATCLAIGLFAPELIQLLGYSSYAKCAPLVLILGPAYLLLQLYVFFPGFAVAERTRFQLIVSIIAAIGAVAFNYLLIGMMGLTGAAFASLAASALFFGLWVAFSQPLYPVPARWGKLALYCVLFAACAILGRNLAAGSWLAMCAKIGMLALLAGAALALGLIRAGQLGTIIRMGIPKPA